MLRTRTYVRALRSQLARGQISLQTISFLLLSAIQRGRVEGRGETSETRDGGGTENSCVQESTYCERVRTGER